MPALPRVLAQSAGAVVGVPNVQVTNGAVAEGLGRAAAGLERLDAKFQEADERNGRIWATRRNAELRASLIKAGTERELSGEPLDNFGSWYETAAKEAYSTALDDAPNDFGRMYLDDYSVSAVSNFGETGLRKEADYRVTQSMTQLDGTLESLKSLAFLDPGNAETYAAQWRDALDGTPLPYDKAAALKDSEQAIFGSAIGSMVENDPYSALGKVDGWVKEGYLNAEQGLTFQNRAQAGIKSREAEAKQRAAESRAAAAEAAGEYLAGADDYFAYRAAGNPPDAALEAKYSPEAIAALPIKNAGNLAKKAADVQIRGDAMLAVRAASSPEERRAIADDVMIRASNPENYQFNAETARLVVSDIQNFEAQLEKAPGDVAFGSSRVQAAVDSGNGVSIVSASYAEQERLGVPAFKRQPLSESYAASVADQIATLPPDQQAAALQDMAKSYGSYWPDVLKQIGGKLPGPLAVAATMPEGRAATRVAETAGLKIDELTAGLDKDASRNVDEAISDNERFASLATVLGSQVGGAKTLGQYGEAIKRSALLLMREGKSEAEAVEQATAEITADIDFRSVGQSVVAIPTAANPDMVEAGLSSIASNFDVTDVDLPPSATGMNKADVKAAYASSIRRNGQWVPDGSGKGVYLYVEGDPVTRGGAPVLFTWDDLKAAGLPKDGFMFEQGR